jgi:hypothetical protein
VCRYWQLVVPGKKGVKNQGESSWLKVDQGESRHFETFLFRGFFAKSPFQAGQATPCPPPSRFRNSNPCPSGSIRVKKINPLAMASSAAKSCLK